MKKIKTTVCVITAVLTLALALPAHAEGFRQGDKSDEIAAVQSVLKSKKLYSGEVNGLFDRLTASAVEKMQQTAEYSLKNNSDFFNGMLFGSINGQNSIAAANRTDSLAGTDTDDGAGSPNEITLDTLKNLGLYSGKELTGEATLKTEAWLYLAPSTRALKLVQLASGTHLEIIKNSGSWTLVRLTALGAEGYVKKSSLNTIKGNISGAADYIPSRSIARTQQGSDVLALQQRLCELGYYKGTPGGSFGSLTYMAVRQFQSANSIECTGVAGIETLAVLFGDDAVPCPEAYDVQITAAAPDSSNTAEQLAHYSQSYLGIKYVLGATGPKAYDCSGFARAVYAHFGYQLPRTAYYQGYGNIGEKIKKINQLECGDLVFFNTNPNDSDKCDHVGIYLGEGSFIHASTSEGKVVISDINKRCWSSIFSWGRRVITAQ